MRPEQQSLIEWQLTKLHYASAYFMDNGEFEKMIELFTPDALFDRAGTVHHGHDEIRQGMRERPPMTTRHLLANIHYLNVTEDHAEAVTSAITFHGPVAENGKPVPYATTNGRVLDFHDTYTHVNGEWKISSRVAHVVFTPDDWPGRIHRAAQTN
jgi:hypothetical protein